ncbi:nucleoside phosphorylase domain-containing protein [Hypoxylon argillaceum]|nr:nucleoside phosphorylase domain-containing protein [Hypoxylon argillaceum]
MASQTQKTRDAYTVAILCAMDLERNAVRYILDEEHHRLPNQPGDSNSYTLGKLNGHDVVLACLPSQQGKGAAATVATNMSRSFPSIKWRLFVGIGGGVPSEKHDIRLGDVVISMPEGEHPGVVQYDLRRETTSGFELKGFLWPLPTLLRNASQDMRSDHLGRDSKIEEYMEAMFKKWPRMISYKEPMEPDVLFEADFPHPPDTRVCTSNCDPSRAVARPARQFKGPVIHYGLIASGDSVIKNATIRDELARRFAGDVLCFEMEAAGLLTEYPSIVIRGISDYADSHKNSTWQHYAAATAAACAKELLSYIDPEVAALEPASASEPKASASNVFTGQGMLNTGSISVGRDFSITK